MHNNINHLNKKKKKKKKKLKKKKKKKKKNIQNNIINEKKGKCTSLFIKIY